MEMDACGHTIISPRAVWPLTQTVCGRQVCQRQEFMKQGRFMKYVRVYRLSLKLVFDYRLKCSKMHLRVLWLTGLWGQFSLLTHTRVKDSWWAVDTSNSFPS